MKLFYLCAGIACVMMTSLTVNAQAVSASSVDSSDNKNLNGFSSNVPLNEIRSKAFRYFLKRYPKVENEKWHVMPEGISVIFSDSTARIRLLFDKKGNFILSDKVYSEKGLMPELKNKLATLFPGYSILTVDENYNGSELSQHIIMKDERKIKSIEMIDDKIKTIDEFEDVSAAR